MSGFELKCMVSSYNLPYRSHPECGPCSLSGLAGSGASWVGFFGCPLLLLLLHLCSLTFLIHFSHLSFVLEAFLEITVFFQI